ncbi:MarR family transcriptional regulator (plasmid) [Streptomyces castrisilvae]|uniref:MarR family transcriptional regulator n=1 Tax=Streptomyces castrisilvae TaxID=3033811 RepID=A0ABY9HV43_9ACTN|nr:MarR family transcriptional regulator [Streptomyces sp. Mut1]WLQ38447.1 MarR family transcriptional regulator [Streptomyces sp. Mut1]
MAAQHSSPALPTAEARRPFRTAHSGYGKRSLPGREPARPDAFDCLPERERYVAGYLDRLPDGAAMDIKSLAKDLPLYGQMAIGTALRALAVAGHLRRVRCQVEAEGTCRWVTLTYWSRTAHDNEWWTAALRGAATTAPAPVPAPCAEPADVPPQRTARRSAPEPPAPPKPGHRPDAGAAPAPEPVPAYTAAYLALAELGRREPRMALSAADCAALEPLAAAWLARGVGADHLTSALTSGLPERVAFPAGLARRRLIDKMPPRLPDAPAHHGTSVRGLQVECAECGHPGPAEALPDGLCRPCRTAHQPTESAAPVTPDGADGVPARVAGLRTLLRTPRTS